MASLYSKSFVLRRLDEGCTSHFTYSDCCHNPSYGKISIRWGQVTVSMKGNCCSKNMNKPRKISFNRFWQEATRGETLNRWSATGSGSYMSGVFFVFKRASNPFKSRQEASLWLTWPDDNPFGEKSQNEIKNQYRKYTKRQPRQCPIRRGSQKGGIVFSRQVVTPRADAETVRVRNPYAEGLKLPDYIFKPLRTNSHYLQFIEVITFYHQYQRPLKPMADGTKYIETTVEDIEAANELLKDVLLAKSDELPKAIRDFFEQLKGWVKKGPKESFYTKEMQEHFRIYPMKISRYLRELESRSFIKRTGGNRKNGFEYEVNRWEDYARLQSGLEILNKVAQGIRITAQKQQNSKNNTSVTTV